MAATSGNPTKPRFPWHLWEWVQVPLTSTAADAVRFAGVCERAEHLPQDYDLGVDRSGLFVVTGKKDPSSRYLVDPRPAAQTCTCPHRERHCTCKHILGLIFGFAAAGHIHACQTPEEVTAAIDRFAGLALARHQSRAAGREKAGV